MRSISAIFGGAFGLRISLNSTVWYLHAPKNKPAYIAYRLTYQMTSSHPETTLEGSDSNRSAQILKITNLLKSFQS